MRVTFDCTIFGLQRFGGISTYAANLARHLDANPGVELTLGLPRRLTISSAGDLATLEASTRHELLPAAVTRYLPVTIPSSCDIFHTAYYRAPAMSGARVVVSVYDFIYERYRTGLARAVHHQQKSAAIKRADAIVCISTATAADVVRYVPGVDPAKLCVIPLACDPATYFMSSDPRRDLGDSIVFVGQRQGYKRFDLAVAAVAATGLRLAIVGNPVDADERNLLDRHLRGRWHQFGRVDDATLRNIYAGALGFIYPSDYEGFGLPILEAQACGCPAVVAHRSSFPEVGGDAALYAMEQTAESYAALLNSLGDSERRAAVVAAGLENVARFSWEQTAAATLGLYRGLLP